MAFPYVFEENFELGTLGAFDSQVGTVLDFPHYSELARKPGLAMPFRGAFCMRVDLAAASSDEHIEETGGFDIAANGTLHMHFNLWLSDDLTMANNDIFDILAVRSASANEGVISLQFTDANGLRLGMGETAGSTQLTSISKSVWHTVEFFMELDQGTQDDGTLDLRLDGGLLTQITALGQAAVTHARLGATGVDAGTTGTILIDNVITDEARLFPFTRFPQTIELTKTGHVFVGSGSLESVSLISGNGTDCTLDIFDSDDGLSNAGFRKLRLQNVSANEIVPDDTPINFTRGCFVVLAGTDPRAMITVRGGSAYSEGGMRQHGHRRESFSL